jgi:protein SCO1
MSFNMPLDLNRRSCLAQLVMLSAAASLVACGRAAAVFQGIDLTGADYAKDFDLSDVNGRRRNLGGFAGKVTVVFFGYTQCPDVCPTTLTDLVEVKKQLGNAGHQLQVIFITLDPERDTPDVLQPYMAHFDPDFVALIPSLAQLPGLTSSFKVFFRKVPADGGAYTVDHTAGNYVYDKQGHVRLFHRYGLGVTAMAADILQLIKV